MRMSLKTLESLQGAIRKWDKVGKGICPDQRAVNCPLCTLFTANCAGRPVADKTKQVNCAGTPYYTFHALCSPYEIMEGSIWANTPKRKEAARLFRDWLCQLLPKVIRPNPSRRLKAWLKLQEEASTLLPPCGSQD